MILDTTFLIDLMKEDPSAVRKVLDTLTSMNILGLNAKSAAKAGEMQGTLIKEGKMIDPEDAMIAGIALHNNETVLTKNVAHFSRIRDLKIETY